MTKYKHTRFIRNYLLQPLIQLRMGVATIVLMLGSFVLLSSYIYFKMANFTEVVVTLTQSDDAIKELIRDYINSTGAVAFAIVVGALIINTLITIYFTHKMVGPTVAFRRQLAHLQKGVYGQRVALRHGDAFVEVANDLNKLAESLEERHGSADRKAAS